MNSDSNGKIQRQDLVGSIFNGPTNEVNQSAGGASPNPSIINPTIPRRNFGVVKAPDDPAIDDITIPTTPHLDPPVPLEPNNFSPAPQIASPFSTPPPAPNEDELHSVKQLALQELGPLVEHIELDPEERFDTLLMMIRSSDDTALIKPAHKAAQAITDDHKRAQALLDIINEVNYLTRPKNEEVHN